MDPGRGRSLQQLDQLHIPRCLFRSWDDSSRLQIHLFVDASETAYAAVVFFRLETERGIEVVLVGAKTKVVPLKTLSFPRLELKAAVLSVRMLETFQKYPSYTISQRYCWSDASTVLAWVRSTDHRRCHKFIAARVGEILSSTQQSEWRWVPSAQNVADLATKWNNIPQVTNDNPWFQGPAFFQESEERWPKQRTVAPTEEELRTIQLSSTLPTFLQTWFSKGSVSGLKCFGFLNMFFALLTTSASVETRKIWNWVTSPATNFVALKKRC